ncbi:ABC transporter ATP-binding protein [Botrimarina sp.]|uniref:peptidase domain-containing ABC transporter n=1 Tax=Botrimarina sp. TaxID=2795802 RepID=UPI0032EE8624
MSTAVSREATLGLPAALVRVAREGGVELERVRAEQLLRDAQSAWPGKERQRWDKWLREAAASASLRCRIADLTPRDALRAAADGAMLAGAVNGADEVVLLLGDDRGRSYLATGEIDTKQRVSYPELKELFDDADPAQPIRWVIIDHPQLCDADEARHLSHSPVRRYGRLLRAEWSDIWIVIVFAFFAGSLSLATPIAVEALVTTVAFGSLLQPVVVLAALLFGFLAFAAVMRALQVYVVEIIQRRMFARVSADLAYRLPRVDHQSITDAFGPELVNRFLDVATLQKVSATLLTDGISVVLAALVGMTVLGFYHPWLLGFDVLLLLTVVAGLFVLGRGAIPTGIVESKYKYRLTAWLEDVMRCPSGFKTHGGADFANDRANEIATGYLNYRRQHFGVLFGQILFILALQAIAGTVLLGVGGWLVIDNRLTLGQLVAAELIVAMILASLAKLGKHLEGFYDVVAAVDKLGILFDLPIERLDGVLALPDGEGLNIRLTRVSHPYGGRTLAKGLSLAVASGEKVAVLGPPGSGKTTLMQMLFGGRTPASGHVEIEKNDPRDLRPDVLREHVALAGEPELFEGTIAENIEVGRPGISATDIRSAVDAVGLLDVVLSLPDGLDTKINASGRPLSLSQRRLLTLARALAGQPRLLLIDGMLDTLPDEPRNGLIELITSSDQPWTVVVATGHRAVAERFDRILKLEADDPPPAVVPIASGETA